jgi:hypothetical protein
MRQRWTADEVGGITAVVLGAIALAAPVLGFVGYFAWQLGKLGWRAAEALAAIFVG